MLRPGIYLQDRYEILELIGSGGMSDVYKARCHKLNRLVAVKVLKEEFSTDENFVGKFKMEAQAAAGLSHPNIVNIYDVIDEGNIHYIVMELIEGITLKNYISKKGHLEVKETIGIAIQVAQGIAAAHEQNIIHRDIKPQNMIISRDGKVKVADFGIARAVSAQTLNSAAMGSVHYISPEQARGGYSDTRSDIYSLGITMFEMATGRLPFEGDNTVTIALAHLEEPITRPSIYNPDIPVSLERIILKCTEKKPERRYSSASEVINDLRKALVNPNDDFVKTAPLIDHTAQTVTISDKELELIKGTHRPVMYDSPGGYEHPPAYEREPEYEIPPVFEQSSPRRGRPSPPDRHSHDSDDINPNIERLLSAVGVIAAIIIVAVLIFIFARLGGIFNMGSPKDTQESTEVSTTVPDETTLSPTKTHMPDLMDLPEDQAEAKLKEETLIMRVSGYEYSDTYAKGHVMFQEIEEGQVVDKHSTVSVVISNGSNKVDLGSLNLLTMDTDTAKRLLESRKLQVEIKEENHDTIAVGKLIRYEPEDSLAEGETVTLYSSLGPAIEMTIVPMIAGQTEEAALGLLVDAGLIPGNTAQEASDTVPQGTIISQLETAGSQVAKGSGISYVVSSGPEVSNKRFVAAINETYNLSNLIGPGSGGTSVQITIKLKQTVDGKETYRTLMKAQTIYGDELLPVVFPTIEGAPGVTTGEVQVIDVETDAVLKSYPVTFFEME